MTRSQEFNAGFDHGRPQRTWREDFPEHDVPQEITGIEGLVDRSAVEPERLRPHPIGPQFMRDWGEETEPGHHRVKVIVAHPDPEQRELHSISEHRRYTVIYHTNESEPEKQAFPPKKGWNAPGGMSYLYEGEDPKEAARTTVNAVIHTNRFLRQR